MSTSPAAFHASRLQQAGPPMLFLILGIIFATLAARIPALRDKLQLNAAELGLVLLCGGGGAVASFPIAASLVERLGASRAAWRSGLILISLLACLAFSPNMGLLMLLMFGLGASQTSFNVAINAVGSHVEKLTGRSVLSQLHAWYCVGTLAGSLIGSQLAGIETPVATHFSVVSLLLLGILSLSCRPLPLDVPAEGMGKKRLMLPRGPLFALGVICFFVAIVEGAITDWSSIYMRDQLGTDEGMAPLGYAAFSSTMLGVRLAADRFKAQFGARTIVVAGALLAATGIALIVTASSVAIALVAFGVTGAGLATIFPFIFSAAGRRGASALAGVGTMGYSGILIGPPTIGFVTHSFGLQAAFLFIGLMAASIAVLASRARWLD